MQQEFLSLADHLVDRLRPGEDALAWFQGETSDFVRFNHGRVRQPGSVTQRYLQVTLVRGHRHASFETTVTGDPDIDRPRIDHALTRLGDRVGHLPEDPWFLWCTAGASTSEVRGGALPDATEVVDQVLSACRDLDLVGIYAGGDIHIGFANSRGQRNWASLRSFHLDWSLFHEGDKAVKSSYAGFDWQPEAFLDRMARAREQLDVLARPSCTVPPGRYRVYLAPPAVAELLDLLGRGGFGLKSHRTRATPLLRMVTGRARLHPSITLAENTAAGTAPPFQAEGFPRPDSVPLIRAGQLAGTLVSPRSAKEFGVPTTGANEQESPESLDMAPGDIPVGEVLDRLGDGIYVGNLWYLNFSDRSAGRITGMTRFATFQVRNGRIQAPIEVMRFDETIYRAFGDRLVGLTAEREFLPRNDTYFRRSTRSLRVPGMLVDDFTFTL